MENQSNVVEEVKTEGGAVETQEVNEVVKEEKTFTQAELDKILNKKFAQEQRVNSTSKVLASNNLPIEFADFLIAESDEATTQRVDLFKNAFNEALEKALNERLRGSTPKTSTGKALEISKEEFRKMSLAKQAELKATKPNLYKELTKR